MKGNISEFEVNILRSRMLDAARAKAQRRELRISVPVGYVWHRELDLDFDPDQRFDSKIQRSPSLRKVRYHHATWRFI
jgi:hypothetical protein